MPKYFKHNSLNSFRRQLSLYGYTRINSGPDTGGYYHELFLRGRPALVSCIRRVGIVKAVPRVRGIKPRGSTVDPDLYIMPEIKGAIWPHR
jgi:HSF-type DNA-binding